MRAPASALREQLPQSGTRRSNAYLVCLLLVLATVSWRPDTYYSGGLDPVVIIKALLSAVALTMAWNERLRCSQPQPVRTGTVWFLLAYVAISVFGAWSINDVVPSLVLGVRVLIIALAVVLLARSLTPEQLLPAWLGALLTVGLIAAATGVASVASGRLGGGMPPLHPNELATVCGLPAIGLTWLVLQGRARSVQVVLLGLMVTIVWLSGSRGALFAVLVAVAVMGVQVRRLSRSTMVATIGALCALVYVVTATDGLDSFFLRGGAQNVTTLSSRTIAWSAAFSFSDSEWVRWMGAGMATKEIPVAGQYWQTQVLDSSWVSALVHAGRAGVILLAMWTLTMLVASLSARRAERMAFTALLAFVILVSFLQNGLLDGAPSFITFFLISLLAGASGDHLGAPSRHRGRSPAAVGQYHHHASERGSGAATPEFTPRLERSGS